MKDIAIFSTDSEINRRLSLMFEDEAYSIRVFENRDEMSYHLKQKLPSLVIFECRSDCIEDSEQIQFINTIANEFSFPILLIITRKQLPRFNSYIRNGHVSYLEKPILYANLLNLVRNLLCERHP